MIFLLDPPSQVQRWHQGNEHFGRAWQTGDVVGCMVDLNERTMLFTLNGEVLLDDSGSELAFKDFEVSQGQSYVKEDRQNTVVDFFVNFGFKCCLLLSNVG